MKPYFIKMDAAELMRLTESLESDYLLTGNELSLALFEKAKDQLREFANQQPISYQFFSKD